MPNLPRGDEARAGDREAVLLQDNTPPNLPHNLDKNNLTTLYPPILPYMPWPAPACNQQHQNQLPGDLASRREENHYLALKT
ncbi:hypothetical protein QC764_0052550 [Podospora pseudoanserina]|uniref:Uncharacterized protein n=1 Tax=Podospora pseudoanserina TaxID=2609844 RepID=A0ABR0ICP0_9PEZI|nr:hypothetical protein QC764_0052550 [Podospora pseudoanserina]